MLQYFRFSVLVLMSTICIVASARTVLPSEARQIANDFFGENVLTNAPIKIKGFKTSPEEVQPFYVFNSQTIGNGFVIVSGDDRAQRILAYSNSGSFDADNIPPQLAELLNHYAEQINSISTGDTHPSWNVPFSANSENGVLLETANWGQNFPYNQLTPEIDGKHAPTGCVATAIGIVMKYHNWPKSYDWSAIDSGDENKLAHLLYDIGKKVKTKYGKDESGTPIGPVPQYLYSKFNFDGDCQLISRKNFNDEQYFKLLRKELDAYRPIISVGGINDIHCFVIDGYENSLLHINWGWEGIDNGYFSLDSFAPGERNFSFQNKVIIGITPHSDSSIDYSNYAYMDAGYGGWLETPIGLTMDCEKIVKEQWFVVTYNTLNVKENVLWTFALVAPDNTIKQIAEDKINFYPGGHVNESEFEPGIWLENKIRFNSDVADSDRLALVVRPEDLSEQWKIIRGTIEAPSIIKAVDYKMPFSSMIWDVDDDLKFIISDQIETVNYTKNTLPKKMLKGKDLTICAYSEAPGLVVLEYNGVRFGRDINTMFSYYPHKNGIGGDLFTIKDQERISFRLIPPEECIENLSIKVDEPGTLEELIPDGKFILGLKIQGKLNAHDFFSFRNCASPRLNYLQTLDLSDVEIFDEFDGDWNKTNILPEYALCSHPFLQKVVLPSNLVGIGDYSLSDIESLREVEIPEKVKFIGKGAFNLCVMLRKVTVHSLEPIEIDSMSFSAPFEPNQLLLSVPIGAKADYKKHPVWSNFGRIVEGNKKAEKMILKARDYCRDPHDLSDSSTVYHYHEGDAGRELIFVQFQPEDAAEYFYSWSSDPQSSFPSFANHYGPLSRYGGEWAKISPTGNFTTKEGLCTYYIESSSGLLRTFMVHSYPKLISISDLTISQTELCLKIGESAQLESSYGPLNANFVRIAWESEDSSIATVDSTGMVIGVAQGVTTIKLTSKGPYPYIFGKDLSTYCTVTVNKDAGISQTFVDDPNKLEIFDITGARHYGPINVLSPGFYIINGKKVVVR